MSSNHSDQAAGCGCFFLIILVGGFAAFLLLILPRWSRPNAGWSQQGEAKAYVGAMNRAQQAYHLEMQVFTSDFDRLGLGLTADTKNYRYHTFMLSKTAVQNNGVSKAKQKENFGVFKKFFQDYLGLGNYVELSLNSYTGLVRVVEDENGEKITLSILCESMEPTSDIPPAFTLPEQPTAMETTIPCPDGYQPL